ncbi:hypothetical protein ACOSQ2_008660 [Xanthoceras sorbifolium]
MGKQCWRILKEPSLLAVRVLKSCYFPDSYFLEAKAASSGSFAWKSLLWGPDLVSKGARWRIGNGLSVFLPSDVECILSIPYSGLSLMDSLQWHFSKDGHYSVRVPSKIKIFQWHASLRWLPTAATLAAHGMEVHDRCSLCCSAVETPLHAL